MGMKQGENSAQSENLCHNQSKIDLIESNSQSRCRRGTRDLKVKGSPRSKLTQQAKK
jgi:hypothetical protein